MKHVDMKPQQVGACVWKTRSLQPLNTSWCTDTMLQGAVS